jgi:hypothetical protein
VLCDRYTSVFDALASITSESPSHASDDLNAELLLGLKLLARYRKLEVRFDRQASLNVATRTCDYIDQCTSCLTPLRMA